MDITQYTGDMPQDLVEQIDKTISHLVSLQQTSCLSREDVSKATEQINCLREQINSISEFELPEIREGELLSLLAGI